MNTLVVHMEDASTDFLCKIYEGKSGWRTLYCDPTRRATDMRELIQEADRVICLGHGSPQGLFGLLSPYVIGDEVAPLFKGKPNIFIWCHASDYLRRHGLTSALTTGMFISEVLEARFCGIAATQAEVDHSNRVFTDSVAKHVDSPDILELVCKDYGKVDSEVARYNLQRLTK